MTCLLYLPLFVLSAAFLILCVHHGTAWPWNVVVHEDGRRTLLDTIFYFEHALAELPLDLLLSAAVAGAMLWSAYCLAIDAVIVAGAVIHSGARVAALYLFQFHTRDDEPMVYGSHWRYHLISQTALMLIPLAFVRRRNPILITTWSVFAALTIALGIDSSSFIDPRYLGHQARELFTHTLVTIPLALAMLTPRSAVGPPAGLKLNRKPALVFLPLSTYLAAGVLLTGAQHQAQSNDFYLLGARHA